MLESDCDFTAPNKSCINWLSACAGFCDESLEDVDELEEVESVDEVDDAEELALAFASGGGPPGGGAIESPTWLKACMTPCISVPSPEPDDSLPVC